MRILKSFEIFEFLNFLKFWNILKILNFIILKFVEIFDILYEFLRKKIDFVKFWPYLLFDWSTGNAISSLVGQRWNTE